MKVKYQTTKTLVTKPNNNSSDFISPNLVYNCGLTCSYCYVHRYNKETVYVNINQDDILNSIINTIKSTKLNKPNQQGIYPVVDLACNTDLSIYQKILKKHCKYSLLDIWSILSENGIRSTQATKYPKLYITDVHHLKIPPRIRISLMPQIYSDILEPGMQSIESRIKDINRLISLGYETQINYSPIICYKGWTKEYNNLFAMVKKQIDTIKCEVIFLTNHERQMYNASEEAKELMKYSNEVKNKQGIMRYPIKHKHKLIQMFKNEYSKYFDLRTIRYIF